MFDYHLNFLIVFLIFDGFTNFFPLAPPTGNKEKYGWLARLSELDGRPDPIEMV